MFKPKFQAKYQPKYQSSGGGDTPPPSGNLIVSDASAFVGPLGVGYLSATMTGGAAVGSLNPPLIVDGQAVESVYGIISGGDKFVSIGFDDDAPAQILATFNGVSYTLTDGFLQTDELFDFLSANQDTPIQFTAVAI
jgi:hypothetical protein